jgi:adenosylmethionine-8-amino-7-oxononanoate aminotransferase/carbon monoxide dehydrogenase subunit G
VTRVAGEKLLPGTPERVWSLLTDAAELARAMPGAGEVEPAHGGERRYRTRISLAVGPVKDVYDGVLGYEDERPPSACTIVVETTGRAGRMSGRGEMRLEPRDAGGTVVHYEGNFKVSGQVATVGQRMIAGVARTTIERTLDGLAHRLGEPVPADAPSPDGKDEREGAVTAFWHPFANMAQVARGEVVITRAEGCEVFNREGRRYLDATASLWYCNVGYGRREVAAAVERQLSELPAYSTFGVYANEPALALAERVARLAPIPDAKVFLTSGGSDAVDTAAKLARRYWSAVGKPDKRILIGRRFAYHGMHAYGTSLGGIPANIEGLGPIVPEVVHVDANSVDAFAAELERLGPGNVAAFIGEPVIGAGGVIPPPDGYWPAVAALCRRHDVLLIDDEVITGFGRLGRWFACERFDVQPDLIVFAKGVTSGYLPLGGVIVGPRVQEPFWTGDGVPFRHGYTYSGHAAACAAALANLDILERENLIRRVVELEPVFAEKVGSLGDHSLVGETRAIGLVGAVELARQTIEREPALVDDVVTIAREEGVLTRSLRGCALQLSPPFTITPEQVDAIVAGLRRALDTVARTLASRPPDGENASRLDEVRKS